MPALAGQNGWVSEFVCSVAGIVAVDLGLLRPDEHKTSQL